MKGEGKPDYILMLIVFSLVSIGMLMVYGASSVKALSIGGPFFYGKRHLFSLCVGAAALFIGYRVKYSEYSKYSLQIFLVSLFFLFLVRVPGMGQTLLGGTRWLDIFGFSFQPSELMKISLIIFLSTQLTNKGDQIKDLFYGVIPVLIVTLFVAYLVYRQPDLGTTVVIIATVFVMLFIAGARKLHLASLVSIGALFVLAASLTSKYRLRRLIAFIDPSKDLQNAGWQISQSLVSVGSGGFFGLGIGNSRQKYFYLPQHFTDFIFAIFCEETGFIGAAGLIILFSLFIARGVRVALNAPDMFSTMLSSGIVFWIGLQMFINAAVVVGLLPTTGIPMPFISYGGSSIVVTLFATGILLNISKYVGIKE